MKTRSICHLGMLLLSPLFIFARNWTTLPHNGHRLCCFCLWVFFQRFPQMSVLLAPGGASSRCDSPMKSIWDFQWTLERVALISRDYVSRAVTCQSPSEQRPRPAPRSSSPAPVSGDPVPVAEGPVIHPARWYPPAVGPNLPTKTFWPWVRRTHGLLLCVRHFALTPACVFSNSQNSPWRRTQWSRLSPVFITRRLRLSARTCPSPASKSKAILQNLSSFTVKPMLFFLHILIFIIKVICVHRKKCWKQVKL